MERRFRFEDEALQADLQHVMKDRTLEHGVAEDGSITYQFDPEDLTHENAICSVRDSVFGGWMVLTCPEEEVATYERYMLANGISHRAEIRDGKRRFLLSDDEDPHAWEIPELEGEAV